MYHIHMAKILIVEDDAFLRDVLEKKCRDAGYEVETCSDGKEVISHLKSFKPNLMLLDVTLPGQNGYEILETKQKDTEVSSIPTIIISNSGEAVELNRVRELGVRDYLVKAQFDPEEVLEKIKKELGESTEEDSVGDVAIDVDAIEAESAKVSSGVDGKTIMWVEDDPFLSDLLARKIGTTGARLMHFATGTQLFDALATTTPDIVIVDLLLSDAMDGFEILQKMKEGGGTKNIPVIILSNLGQQSDIDKANELGAARFLVKATVDIDEIIEHINSVISK